MLRAIVRIEYADRHVVSILILLIALESQRSYPLPLVNSKMLVDRKDILLVYRQLFEGRRGRVMD